jgi:hypothetical protein
MARFGLTLFACLLFGPQTFACSVPVFRYALERWQPAKYELVVYHRGPLSRGDMDAVRRFEATAVRANVRITDADLDGRLDVDLQAVWDREGKDDVLPRLVLRYPDSSSQVPSVWSRPLSADREMIFNSPARRAVFERLTAGHAAVVVLLLSGDPAADQAARSLLQAELSRIADGIELPRPAEDGPQVQSELPLWIDFPVIEVPRTPAEDTLVRLLLGSEDGLADVKGPIAFPVFGRGRALCSLHGNDLTSPAELKRSLEFLCKACSCQVKELNPGVDLLMTANWDVVFDAERGPAPRVVATSGSRAAETRAHSAGEASAGERRAAPPAGYSAAELEPGPRQPSARSPLLRLGTAAAGLLVLVTGFWAFRGRRTPPPPAP